MEEDKINKLPNDIVVHIISFLPTRDAVGTSVLSTRWKYLWTLTATFDFSDYLLYDAERTSADLAINTKFMDFVDRVLLLHDRPKIDKFKLSCELSIDYDATWFDAWFSTVLKRSIQELTLTISLNHPYYFPRCLSQCQSLTTLRLYFESDGYIKIPGSICFPKLKVLYLNFIAFHGEQSVRNSYLSFPVLKEFFACNFKWVILNIVNIYAPMLKRFTIDDYPVRGADTIHNCEINLYAESLTFLELTTNLSCNYSLHNLSSLVDAFIDVPTTKDICRRMVNLLGGIYINVQDLKLSENTIENLFNHNAIAQLPTFSSLIHLTVIVECDGFDARCLIKLLDKLPNVKSLVFQGPYTCDYVIQGSAVECIPQCLSHLKSFEIGYFNGSEYEVCLVEFFLKNAIMLENMNIFLSMELSRETIKKEEASKKLLMLSRASKCCVVNLDQSLS